MSDTDPELDRLQELLATIPPEWKGINVVELDGYVAALIVCPDTIPPVRMASRGLGLGSWLRGC